MTNVKKLNDEIRKSGLKIGVIAKELNLSRTGLHNKLIGKNDFFSEEIYKISKILGLDEEKIIDIFLK